MTVAEARQVLGDEIQDMTDTEVIRMIAEDSQLIDVLFVMFEAKRLSMLPVGGTNESNGL